MSGIRDELIAFTEFSYEEQMNFINILTEAERTTQGTVDSWSAKDVMAHVVGWNSDLVVQIGGRERDQAVDADDIDQANANIWQKYRDTSWIEVERLIQKNHDQLMILLGELSEQELNDPEWFDWMNGRPLWRSISFGYLYHSIQHIAIQYYERGDVAYANKLQENVCEMQLRLDHSDQWRGTVLYNLGCHYAITDQRDQALSNVRQGLALYPDLKEWAPKDSDLKLLHSDPEFLNLVSD